MAVTINQSAWNKQFQKHGTTIHLLKIQTPVIEKRVLALVIAGVLALSASLLMQQNITGIKPYKKGAMEKKASVPLPTPRLWQIFAE